MGGWESGMDEWIFLEYLLSNNYNNYPFSGSFAYLTVLLSSFLLFSQQILSTSSANTIINKNREHPCPHEAYGVVREENMNERIT